MIPDLKIEKKLLMAAIEEGINPFDCEWIATIGDDELPKMYMCIAIIFSGSIVYDTYCTMKIGTKWEAVYNELKEEVKRCYISHSYDLYVSEIGMLSIIEFLAQRTKAKGNIREEEI